MAFLTLYRKYRPQDFNDIVGQDYIIKTLENALTYDRIGHAYLFAGPRGTGKTSTAKVLARALNCQQDSSIEPCGECDPCVEIEKNQSINVIEIDAASNRGIDEIREIREKIKFHPGKGAYKVYIIDEVHMLTKGAFNALLKTLEEPPKSVIFILATTEPHQVINTIHSRCQRFDFSLLSLKNIQKRLAYICKQESVEFEKKALNIIAHSSNGGLRDAISILDQAISYTNSKITVSELTKMLGKVSEDVLNTFLENIDNNDAGSALILVNELIEKGKGVSRFVSDLINYCRQLLLIKECGATSNIIDYTEEKIELMGKRASQISAAKLYEVIEVLTDIDKNLKFSNQPRLILEMGIIKLTNNNKDKQLEQLEQRISKLEEKSFNFKKQKKEVEKKPKTPQPKPKKTDIENTRQKQNNKKDTDKLNLELVKQNWSKIIQRLKKEDINAQAYLVEGKPVKVENNIIYIEFSKKNRFHKKGAEKKKKLINNVVRKTISHHCELRFFIAGETQKRKKSPQEKKNKKMTSSEDSDIMIEKIADLFDGEIIEIDQNHLKN